MKLVVKAKLSGVKTTPKRKVSRKNKRNNVSRAVQRIRKEQTLSFVTDVLVALLTDAFNHLPCYCVSDYRRDVATAKKRITDEGLYFVCKILPELSHGLFCMLEGRAANFPGFKCRNGYPDFLRGVTKNAIAGNIECIKHLYQVSVAFKKLEGEYSSKKVVALWDDFLSCDASLVDIDWFSNENLPIVERARHLCKMMFNDFDVFGENAVPRPGPGATYSGTKPWARYEPHTRYQNVDKMFPLEEWFYPHHFTSYGANLSMLEKQHVQGLPVLAEATSRYKAVPKTAVSLRGICITENEIQYLQQAVRRAMTKHINEHPLYKRRIVLHDQSVNGWIAKESSKTRSMATLDLKSASDLNARELVSWIFQDNVDLHNALMVLSDRYVEPPKEVKGGKRARIHKFAPMGSALCFPVMSLVLMFLIRSCIQLSSSKYPHLDSTNVFVYGDDIVVPSQHYSLVCDTLESFGFKINETKSFVVSYFRESCGVHAYQGVDITPVYIRKTPSKHLKATVSTIETEKQLYDRDLHYTASILRITASLRSPSLGKRRFVPAKSNVIGWKRDLVADFVIIPKYKCKWDPDTQQHLFKARVFSTVPDEVGLVLDSQAYLRWRCLDTKEFSARECPDTAVRDRIRLRPGWVPRSELFI